MPKLRFVVQQILNLTKIFTKNTLKSILFFKFYYNFLRMGGFKIVKQKGIQSRL